jgi:membrane protein
VFNIARWRARWAWVDTALAVNERFGEVGGGPLASSIALAAFVSLFPLLLVIIAVIGFWSAGDSSFASTLVREMGLHGEAAETVNDAIATAEGSRRAASLIGLAGLLWSGLGVVGALQTACNRVWQVQGRGVVEKLVALRWLVGAGLLFLASLALGAVLNLLPGPGLVVTILLGMALTTVLFIWTYTSLGNVHVGWRAHVAGAVLVAVGVEILKVLGGILVPRAVASSSALYGSLGVVFAVLAWLLLYGRLIVYGAALDVVLHERHVGTVTAEIEVPRIDGEVPLTTTRGGAVEGA